MKIIRCENNRHFYDAELYDSCPHCKKEQTGGAPSSKKPPKPPKPPKPEKPNKWKAKDDASPAVPPKEKEVAEQNPPPLLPTIAKEIAKEPDAHRTNSLWEQAHGGNTAYILDETAKASPVSKNAVVEPAAFKQPEVPVVAAQEAPEAIDEEDSPSAFPFPQPIKEKQPQEKNNAEAELQKAVSAVASHSASEDAKTIAFYDFGNDESPVVGWLVCVKGEYQGQGFDIKSGQNYIGRAQNMNIALAREVSVSRNRHAIIIFDPAKQAFYVQKGESSGLTYLNGGLVMEHTPLGAYDKIKLGNAEFVFVPFCGDRFTWDDYIKRQ